MLKNNRRSFNRHFYNSKATRRRKKSLWLDRKSDRHIQVMALMLFVGFFLIIIYGIKTIVTWRVISWIYIGFAVLFSQIPSKLLPFIYRIRKELKVLLAICALAPFFTGMFLVVNFYFTTNGYVQSFKVVDFYYSYSENFIEVDLDNKVFNKHIEIRRFSLDKYDFDPDSAVYILKKGVFGFDVVDDAFLKPKE